MQSELKPCPFCGGEAEYHSDKGPTGEVYAWVGCNQCDAMSVHCDVRSMQPEETHPIEAWNTRASDAELARLTEALRAAEKREKALREALVVTEGAIAEYYRYWTGGETRGSYDGKPERAGLWKAQQIARQAIAAALKEQPHD